MKQLKKTLLTLVALLAVTAGAWAQDYYAPSTDEVIILNEVYDASKSGYSSHSAIAWGGSATNATSNKKAGDPYNEGEPTSSNVTCYSVKGTGQGKNITLSITGVSKVIVYHETQAKYIELREGSKTGNIIGSGQKSTLYTEVELTATNKYSIFLHGTNGSSDQDFYVYAIKLIAAPAAPSSGPKVAWDGEKKTGTFTMPGGNVTLEPDYYPQATAAEGAVTAATDVKATTDAPLVTIDETKLTGAKKLMYYVSTDATAPAYDAEGWTDVLPTAENYTQAATLNVWYYPVGTDEDGDGATATYSDGDICATALTVSLGAAPTYDVTFADDLTEPTLWTASPNAGVTKGTAVTVTYTGTKKVIGVKAEKKSAAEGHALSASAVGEIVGSDGMAYAVADKDNLPSGVTAVAMIAYVGSDTYDATFKNGLAIALADEGSMIWSTAKSTCEGKTAITGAKWCLPSQDQWKQMFKANGGNDSSYSGLNTNITNAGGTALQETGYWSSSEIDPGFDAYYVYFDSGDAGWNSDGEGFEGCLVRACLAF